MSDRDAEEAVKKCARADIAWLIATVVVAVCLRIVDGRVVVSHALILAAISIVAFLLIGVYSAYVSDRQ